jgi:hypothetical protein
MASFNAGKLPPKPVVVPSSSPAISPAKTTDVEKPAPTVTKGPGSEFADLSAKQKTAEKTVADGARADTAHTVSGGLGFETVDKASSLAGVPKDLESVPTGMDRSLKKLEQAISDVKGGGDGLRPLNASVDDANKLLNSVSAYLGKNALLAANELPGVKQLIPMLTDASKKADAGQKELLNAQREQLKGQGMTEKTMSELGAYNDLMLAQKLSEEADKLKAPVFAEYFGKLMVVRPGENNDARQREISAELDSQPKGPASSFGNMASQLARQVEITEGQSKPVRTNEQITQASIEMGVKNGYDKDSLGSQIGYALQDVTNYTEIDQFSKHLLELSLDTVKDVKDPGERLDQAKQRAEYWVGNYGRNERQMDAVWYQALDKHAAALKAG